MTKGEALTLLAASSQEELGDNLLELAVAYQLEEGHSKEDVLDMVALVLEDSGGLEDTG